MRFRVRLMTRQRLVALGYQANSAVILGLVPRICNDLKSPVDWILGTSPRMTDGADDKRKGCPVCRRPNHINFGYLTCRARYATRPWPLRIPSCSRHES
ncbi:hypothetical protein EQW76_00210 [Rhizobium sp. rho-13.1]|nr:hypothetical protein EQW76_00210 [Rhizobium sp. rho-13.1]TQY19203.1 hypothetical protein EQW74_05710 [Rhizobium sp. rho-1.1]